MKAKDKQHYIEAWENHVNDLIRPYIDSGTQVSEWDRVKNDLMAVVRAAADQNFPDGNEPFLENGKDRCQTTSRITGQQCIKEHGHLVAHQWKAKDDLIDTIQDIGSMEI